MTQGAPVATSDAALCSVSSLATGEALAGTAARADRWLLLEVNGAWGRDVEETELLPELREHANGFDGRVLMIRRPDRKGRRPVGLVVDARDDGGTIRRLSLDAGSDPAHDRLRSLVLVCCHGRRDPCCARLGTPVFESLREHVPAAGLWQSSHLGGHRFAANVLVLPAGILLGRVSPAAARRVVADALSGIIPLDHYRGRAIHTPEEQAADAAVRQALGLTSLADVSVLSSDGGAVRLLTPASEIVATVEAEPGPPVVESCGKEPVASLRYSVRW